MQRFHYPLTAHETHKVQSGLIVFNDINTWHLSGAQICRRRAPTHAHHLSLPVKGPGCVDNFCRRQPINNRTRDAETRFPNPHSDNYSVSEGKRDDIWTKLATHDHVAGDTLLCILQRQQRKTAAATHPLWQWSF